MGNAMNGPLVGVRAIDASTLFAGPLAAMFLGDLGADVVKIEHPARPDAARTHGPSRAGAGLWWKTLGRNKRAATLDLSRPEGAALLLRLAERSDVLIENFRPGTLERWGIGPEQLHATNPALVIANYAFDSIRHDVYRVRSGLLQEALVTTVSSRREDDLGDPSILERLRLRWEGEPLHSVHVYEDPLTNGVLAGYTRLADTSIMIPTGALRCIRTVMNWSRDRILLVAGDKCVSNEEELATRGDPILALHGGCFSMTVNFDESTMTGTRAMSGSAATRLRKVTIAFSESSRPSSMLTSMICAPFST